MRISELIHSAATKMKGSYFKNQKVPQEGAVVWALIGQINRKPMKGIATRVEQTYYGHHAYCDVVIQGETYRISMDSLFDHKPRQVEVTDEFGSTKIWE
jgi:hypothetical protein